MRNMKLGYLIIILILMITIISGCNADKESEVISYEYKDLLGLTKSELIGQLGEKYEITTQGVNNQNTGLRYDELGVLVGLDEANDEVVEIQILKGEYLGVSTEMNINEAVEVLKAKELEFLTVKLNNIGTWYIYDLGDFRVRLSEESDSNWKVQMFITLEDFK